MLGHDAQVKGRAAFLHQQREMYHLNKLPLVSCGVAFLCLVVKHVYALWNKLVSLFLCVK